MPVSAILLISFFALLIFNVPVGYSLGCSALITILLAMDLPMEIIVQRFFVTFDSFTMMAIPLFMLAGSLMNGSGISGESLRLRTGESVIFVADWPREIFLPVCCSLVFPVRLPPMPLVWAPC